MQYRSILLPLVVMNLLLIQLLVPAMTTHPLAGNVLTKMDRISGDFLGGDVLENGEITVTYTTEEGGYHVNFYSSLYQLRDNLDLGENYPIYISQDTIVTISPDYGLTVSQGTTKLQEEINLINRETGDSTAVTVELQIIEELEGERFKLYRASMVGDILIIPFLLENKTTASLWGMIEVNTQDYNSRLIGPGTSAMRVSDLVVKGQKPLQLELVGLAATGRYLELYQYFTTTTEVRQKGMTELPCHGVCLPTILDSEPAVISWDQIGMDMYYQLNQEGRQEEVIIAAESDFSVRDVELELVHDRYMLSYVQRLTGGQIIGDEFFYMVDLQDRTTARTKVPGTYQYPHLSFFQGKGMTGVFYTVENTDQTEFIIHHQILGIDSVLDRIRQIGWLGLVVTNIFLLVLILCIQLRERKNEELPANTLYPDHIS